MTWQEWVSKQIPAIFPCMGDNPHFVRGFMSIPMYFDADYEAAYDEWVNEHIAETLNDIYQTETV